MMIQLNPHIPMLTPNGPATAFMVIDYSQEHHLLWVTAINETGEIWAFPNPEVRFQSNPSMGRNFIPIPESWFENESED
jgi:hypothetical protein